MHITGEPRGWTRMLALVAFCVSAVVLGEEIESPDFYGATQGCTLLRNKPPRNFPLVSNGTRKIYPRTSDNCEIVLPFGAKATVGCTPANNFLETYKTNSVDIECQAGGNLIISSAFQSTTIQELGCNDAVKEEIYTQGICYSQYANISIGFNDAGGRQFPLISVCHDDTKFNTIMSQHSLYGGSTDSAEISNARPSFKKAQYYPSVSPQTAYTQSSQLSMMKDLVKSSTKASEYINKDNYFARGHLSPDGDFIYASEQNATYYFVNVVPQWQSINNGNWKAMEVAVRDLAAKAQSTFTIYTGGYDVLKLKDINGNLVDIYLAKNGDEFVLPAPKLTFKIIHDPAAKSAVVIVMVNNPHDQGITSADIICPNICDQLSWIKWDPQNVRKGYTYCCTPETFRKAVPYAPNLGKTKLLA